MIQFQKINLHLLSKLGKKYKHIRPDKCPRCNSTKIWGHGFGERYFDGYIFALYIKIWRCVDCKCVICVRPKGYFSRHHLLTNGIYNNLKYRLKTGTWIRGPDLSRQRQGHWLRSLKKNILLFLGFERLENILDGFHKLILYGRCPVFRST